MLITSPAVLRIDRDCFVLEFLDQNKKVANTIILKDLKLDPTARGILIEPYENGAQK